MRVECGVLLVQIWKLILIQQKLQVTDFAPSLGRSQAGNPASSTLGAYTDVLSVSPEVWIVRISCNSSPFMPSRDQCTHIHISTGGCGHL